MKYKMIAKPQFFEGGIIMFYHFLKEISLDLLFHIFITGIVYKQRNPIEV